MTSRRWPPSPHPGLSRTQPGPTPAINPQPHETAVWGQHAGIEVTKVEDGLYTYRVWVQGNVRIGLAASREELWRTIEEFLG